MKQQPKNIDEAMNAVWHERWGKTNATVIPSAHLRNIVELLYDEVIRQRGEIEYLQRIAQNDRVGDIL